jgi:putative transposase
VELVAQRRDVALVIAEHGLSERQACKLLEVDRSSYRYEPRPDPDAALRTALVELARRKPRFGYRRLAVLLARQGWEVNHKRLYRIYREENLAVRRTKRKRLRRAPPVPSKLTAANQEWAMDFVADSLATGRAFRAFTLVDNFTRECPAIEVDSCLSAQRVTRVLDWVIAQRGQPEAIRSDNGPEFTSRRFLAWCEDRGIRLELIEPGRPMQNGFIESFNGRLRDECLNANWFATLADAKAKIEAWRHDYNHERPHSSLEYLTPNEFAARLTPRGVSPVLEWGQGDSNAIPLPHTPIPAARSGPQEGKMS